jgi:hypothetical protein
MTLTVLSKASVKIATECVKYQAHSLPAKSKTEKRAIYFWMRMADFIQRN